MTSILEKTRDSATATSDVGSSLWQFMQGTLRAIRLAFGAASRAHDRRRVSEAVGAETMYDTGMSLETASGDQPWQVDLPFFMQSGFGKR